MFKVRIANIVAMALLGAVAGRAADPLAGTWVLNVEQSRIRAGLRVTIERRGEAFRWASGDVEYTALLDGDDYPIRGISGRATVCLRRPNERTIQRTYKRDGVPVSGAEMIVSPDDRFLTVRITGMGVRGSTRESLNTYQRVPGSVGKDTFEGTWDRNPVRSLGNSPSTVALEALEGGRLHFTADQVEYSAQADGQDYKVIGTIVSNLVALERIDMRTLKEIWKVDGKVVATVLRVVSEDGIRMSATVAGTTPQGDSFENLYVYTRK